MLRVVWNNSGTMGRAKIAPRGIRRKRHLESGAPFQGLLAPGSRLIFGTMSEIDALREAVRVSPENVPLLLLFGEKCLEEFHMDEAVQTFQKVLAVEPENRPGWLGLATSLHGSGKTFGGGGRGWRHLRRSFPTEPAGWLMLSRFLMAEGQRNQARRNAMRRALKLPGSRQDASLNRNSIWAASGPELRRLRRSREKSAAKAGMSGAASSEPTPESTICWRS